MNVTANVASIGVTKIGPIELPIPLAMTRFDLYVFIMTPGQLNPTLKGFTTAVNQGVFGGVAFYTEMIPLGDLGAAREKLWSNLHGRIVGVKIKPNTFAGNDGIAEFTLTLKAHQDGNGVFHPDDTIGFTASNCLGAAAAGEIAFNAEMLQLPNL
jgi:hypothetical protein